MDLSRSSFSSETTVDFVLITALPEEHDAVLNKLPGYQKLPPIKDDIRTYFQANLPVSFPDGSSGNYRVIVMCLLGMGRVQAVAATGDAIRHWHPRYIVLVGIAGGIATRNIRIGDILISDQVVDFELAKVTPESTEIRWEVHRVDQRLLNACNNFRDESWNELTGMQRPNNNKPYRHTGPIASGDKVIAFNKVLANYQDSWPKLIGVEMEAAGAATAAFQSTDKPGFFMVRGVSDLADENKDISDVQKWRSYACSVAASFTIAFLRSGPVPLLERKNVQLICEGEFSDFTTDRRNEIAEVLAVLLHTDRTNIRILQVNQGSIVLIIEMPSIAANRLYELAIKQDLRLMQLGIKSVLVADRKNIELIYKSVDKNDDRSEKYKILNKKSIMPKINEATDTDLKIISLLVELRWKPGDTLLYQQEYKLTPEQQKLFEGRKSIKPDITLTDLFGNVLAVFENKLEDEKKALSKLRSLYAAILKPRFLYACSPERILFYDTEWKGLEAGEFRQVDTLMSLEDMNLKIEHAKKINQDRKITIDNSIAGGLNPSCGKVMYFQTECIEILLRKFKEGKQKMLVHMATGLGKTRTAVAFVKALLEYNMVKRVLFIVDRVMLAEQAINDGFSLINKEFTAIRITSSNYRLYKNAQIHVVVIDTLENIYQNIPSNYYDLIIVDECHRSININRKLIFDHFLCPRIGLTATPRSAIAAQGAEIPEDDLAILDTYKLFGCETGEPDYQFDLARGIDEGFLAPYSVLSIETELTKTAREVGVNFDHYIDLKTEELVKLGQEKKLMLEQLNRKFISWENCLRVAEELKKNTDYGEKAIVFGVSQAHCVQLVRAINQVFKTADDELSPRYAEAIISENDDLNATFKKWFKDYNHKPLIAVSVDIMGTGVDIPCVRYIGFANITKSVSKYIQMLGRGTRLDPKTGKLSFKVLDFVGLCQRMEDNGKGTAKENNKVVTEIHVGRIGRSGVDGGDIGTNAGMIDNPDPAHLIQRVYLHGDEFKVIDNIPIEKARQLFEEGLENSTSRELSEIKEKAKADSSYEPDENEIKVIKDWAKNPKVFLDEGQLQKVYDFEQGSIWDFFLHALKIRTIPTPRERVERGFESYIKTYDFTDKQIQILRDMKDIVSANIAEEKKLSPKDIFNNPVFERIIGVDYKDVNQIFGNRFPEVFDELQTTFRA